MSIIKSFEAYHATNEAYFGDVLGSEFLAFVHRYRKLVRDKKINPTEHYVHFTNFKDNTLDRTAHSDPNHSDPVGTYAYPLDYVLKHPGDIWYGVGAKFARVLQNNAWRKLVLSDITTESHLERHLNEIGYSPVIIPVLIKKAKKLFAGRFTGKARFAKLFMSIVQMDLETGKAKSQDEQTQLLLRGFDAIEDRSRNIDHAAINDREPEQICFLRRSAFRVKEVVRLHGKTTTKLVHPEVPQRKLANLVATTIGDKLLGASHYSMFWTVKGRQITLSINTEDSYRDGLGIGRKRHRYGKDFDEKTVAITIQSEYGRVSRSFGTDTTFAYMMDYIKHDWDKLVGENNLNPNWEPLSLKVYNRKEEEQRDAYAKQQADKDHEERKEEVPDFLASIEHWNTVAPIKFKIRDDLDLNARLIPVRNVCLVKSGVGRESPEKFEDLMRRYKETRAATIKDPELRSYFIEFVDFYVALAMTQQGMFLDPQSYFKHSWKKEAQEA